MAHRTPQRRTPPAPLGRPFLVVWAGQTISTVGSTLAGIGAAVWVYVTTGSVMWLGVLAALTAIPVVLATPMAAIVDRFDRRAVMIWADVAAAAGPTVALVLALLGHLEPWHVVAAGFIAGNLPLTGYSARSVVTVPGREQPFDGSDRADGPLSGRFLWLVDRHGVVRVFNGRH